MAQQLGSTNGQPMPYRFNFDEWLNMLKKELATALGISGAMVSKLAKRGMPTDSLERAQRWRRRHLEPGRVKGQRMGTTAPAIAPEAASNRRATESVSAVETAALEAGEFLTLFPREPEAAELIQQLRAMLRQLPPEAMPRMPLRVWLCLVDYCLHAEASVRQNKDGGLWLDEVAFAHLVCPNHPFYEWLECACDWKGYAVNGWPEGWGNVDD